MANANRKKVFQQRIPLNRKDPVLFCKEVTKFIPEDYQEELLMNLATSPKSSIKSGHGIGKTATQANALLWFLTCFPYARVVATAPTSQQLHDVLWAEINKWISKSPILEEILHWTKTYVYLDGYERRWFAVAKTAAKPENMQGFHEDNMLFIVDEASGVEDEIMEAILATLSGGNNKLLMCGNPTRTSGTFYDSFHKDRAIYKTMTVSSLDSPRTNKENIEMFKRKYGENSNVFKVRVLGEFPTQEDDVFIPLSIIEAATMRELPELQLAILKNQARYVKKGGVLLYSTCTLLKRENEEVVESFMKENNEFSLEKLDLPKNFPENTTGMLTLVPGEYDTDGFFICRLRRKL